MALAYCSDKTWGASSSTGPRASSFLFSCLVLWSYAWWSGLYQRCFQLICFGFAIAPGVVANYHLLLASFVYFMRNFPGPLTRQSLPSSDIPVTSDQRRTCPALSGSPNVSLPRQQCTPCHSCAFVGATRQLGPWLEGSCPGTPSWSIVWTWICSAGPSIRACRVRRPYSSRYHIVLWSFAACSWECS